VSEAKKKVRILVAVFNYDGWIRGEIADWYTGKCFPALEDSGLVEAVAFTTQFRGYPVTRLRNKACATAKAAGYDYVLMLDNDNIPDIEVGHDPRAVPFFPAALEFAMANGPCCVGAPYGGTPPTESCLVMKWEPIADTDLTLPGTMARYSRREAATLTGFEEVAALPTGMLLIDVKALDRVPEPWFRYEFTNEREYETSATEDVYFTRNLSWVGVPQFVFWDAWAGHVKEKVVRRPHVVMPKDVAEPVRKAWETARASGETV
jgi:hypothetical protein